MSLKTATCNQSLKDSFLLCKFQGAFELFVHRIEWRMKLQSIFNFYTLFFCCLPKLKLRIIFLCSRFLPSTTLKFMYKSGASVYLLSLFRSVCHLILFISFLFQLFSHLYLQSSRRPQKKTKMIILTTKLCS